MIGFNLAGVRVTQVPLGRNEHALPLGFQVAVRLARDYVPIAVGELERRDERSRTEIAVCRRY